MRAFLVIFGLIFGLFGFAGCGDKKNENATAPQSKFLVLESVTSAILEGKEPEKSTPSEILEDAKALISRAKISQYNLIKSSNKELQNALIIATIEGKETLPNAKIFAFAKAISLNDDGSEWNFAADSMGKKVADFVAMLGEDKGRLIVFYDSGEDIFSPAGSAHTALLWARHLGYTNVARIIGGLGAWKESSTR